MSARAKWFIQRHYLTIVACVFVFSIVLAVALYVNGADWKISLAIVGGLLSFIYFIQKQQLEEAKLIKELVVDFNKRYNDLNEKLNEIIQQENLTKAIEEIEGASDTLNDYFNLCGEEYLFYQKGFIYPEVWKSWVRGMKIYYNDARIRTLWSDELSNESYYGLNVSEEIKRFAPTPKHNKSLEMTA